MDICFEKRWMDVSEELSSVETPLYNDFGGSVLGVSEELSSVETSNPQDYLAQD